jgi:hypothetical protein
VKIPEQLQRLGLAIGVIVAVVLVGRFVVMPPRLVARELHRSATVARETAKPIRFAGSAACQDCHDDVVQKKAKSYHKSLSCEGCHGAAAAHVEDPGSGRPPAPRDRKFCPVCHAYDAARPTGFPQINPTAHNPLKPCISCHNAHDPAPPTTPKECSACHAGIERMKAVSSHALLPCTTCHTVPAQHKKTPRTALPSKPESREFCAKCHGTDAPVKEPPKVDVGAHGGPYQCWQCHYPHQPEGRT